VRHVINYARVMCAGLGAALVAVVAVIWKCVLATSNPRTRSEPCRLLVELSERVSSPSTAAPLGSARRVQSASSHSRPAPRYRCCDNAFWSAGRSRTV